MLYVQGSLELAEAKQAWQLDQLKYESTERTLGPSKAFIC